MRKDNRQPGELRPIRITRGFTRSSPGSVLIQAGGTTVLCTASIDPKVPEWMAGKGRGWLTAEYNMLPGSTRPRKKRERDGRLDGRTTEIQRLIGRSLRAVADLDALGERSILVDCDVLEADGGTRTASITGAFIALVDALVSLEAPAGPNAPEQSSFSGEAARRLPLPLGEVRGEGAAPSIAAVSSLAANAPPLLSRVLTSSVAAVSIGLVAGEPLLDLDYSEDSAAAFDMNLVLTGAGQFIEIQGTGEEATFSEYELAQLIALGRQGIERLTAIQRETLGALWPWA
ncbi:MAG TPA: ribonuclease PH [Pirellulales bacterium]|jgi:ribonuclease PH|nr:ribonuclease PH [Pirellulales bacterium]